ncbi:ABC transporter substrate-binding protein [Streptacidiphilus rugosus]|uniref:ABC transporter substrate-binding protein n=1 Tax=Streptacidiphilus rugosus TaxID=405783 RepID=UPI00055CA08E|nr:ABC transporter substrate-binding protein [Streptacidiphilus rugosus]
MGVTGRSTADVVDAHATVSYPDIARVIQLYDILAVFNANCEVEFALAESIESSVDAAAWMIRLKPELEFHNGKPVTADDVVYTFRRILDPADPKGLAQLLPAVDLNNIKILDSLTLQLNLKCPDVTLPEAHAIYNAGSSAYSLRWTASSGTIRPSIRLSMSSGEPHTVRRWRTGCAGQGCFAGPGAADRP